MKRSRLTAGFTLVEVLVALAILAIMAALAWRGVDGIVRARDGSQSRLEQTLRLQTVMAQWEADLSQAIDTHVVPPLMFDGATLRMTRRTPDGVQVVAWSLKGGTWQRWAGPVATRSGALQDAWFQSQQLLGSEPGQLKLLPGVGSWQLYYYIGNAWANAQSSGNQVPNAAAGSASAPILVGTHTGLPDGVRSVLNFGEGSGLSGNLTRSVKLVHPS
ncbi:MAG TPA: prepilin-type N-terminal cleavage/methylation domain-containing protein [Methylibium sp.]